jgi:hypothetical protein
VNTRTLLVSAAAGALVIAGPAATALADTGDLVLASSHDDEDDHGHSHDDDDHSHDDDGQDDEADGHDDDHGHSHDDEGQDDEADGHDDDHGHSHDDDEHDDADVLPSSVDAGSGGLSTTALPGWLMALMGLGALGVVAPVAAAQRRR